MDGVVIDRITATCVYPLSSSNDTVQKPDEWFTVWERKGTSVLEWSNGSTHPIALRVDSNAVKTFSINLGFEGSCTFPSAYPRDPPKFQCKLVGSLEEENVTFTSEAFDVELKPDPKNGSQPPPETHPFDTGLMEVTSPLPESVCRVPFRIAGDIKWKIVKVQPEGAPSMELTSPDPTRLELCFLLNKAPVGRDRIPIPAMKTGVDMQGKWPISLLRLFLPRPTELTKEPPTEENLAPWWAANICKKLQTVRCAFDTVSGKSGFGVSCTGGSFDLEYFTRAVLAPGESKKKPSLVNSFDLSALLQLGSYLAICEDGYDLLDSVWVTMAPYGHFKPCAPFGVKANDIPWPPGLDNPYYRSLDEPLCTKPKIPDGQANKDAYLCKAHSWLEVTISNTESNKVLDISCPAPTTPGGLPIPDIGTRERSDFVKDHVLDPKHWGNRGDSDMEGGCYSNNDFSIEQSGENSQGSPGTDIARVGVYNVTGINQPRRGITPFTPVPNVLRWQLITGIKLGKNPTEVDFGFNDASLKHMNVVPILLGTETGLKPVAPRQGVSSTDFKVTRGATKVTYIFTSMPVTDDEKDGELVVNINVYDKHSDAYQAMLYELAQYERGENALSNLQMNKQPVYVGHYSLQTTNSVLCIRNNLFIDMTIVGSGRPNAASLEMTVKMLQKLDDYLSQRVVCSSQVRRPSMATTSAVERKILLNRKEFSITMKDTDTIAYPTRGLVNDGWLLLCLDPKDENFEHKFVMSDIGDRTDAPVQITIVGAQKDTFHPGYQEYLLSLVK